MSENEKIRILNMVKEGKISVEDAALLLSSLAGEKAPASENVVLKDTRGRKGKKLKVIVDAGDKKTAKVNISIPLSLVKTVGPLVVKNMPKEAKEKLDADGIDLAGLLNDIDEMLDAGMDEDLVNIDSDEEGQKAKVRIYVE